MASLSHKLAAHRFPSSIIHNLKHPLDALLDRHGRSRGDIPLLGDVVAHARLHPARVKRDSNKPTGLVLDMEGLSQPVLRSPTRSVRTSRDRFHVGDATDRGRDPSELRRRSTSSRSRLPQQRPQALEHQQRRDRVHLERRAQILGRGLHRGGHRGGEASVEEEDVDVVDYARDLVANRRGGNRRREVELEDVEVAVRALDDGIVRDFCLEACDGLLVAGGRDDGGVRAGEERFDEAEAETPIPACHYVDFVVVARRHVE